MGLFSMGNFVSHSGINLDYKIECEFLKHSDWECLAYMATQILPTFRAVEGIPRGGIEFAECLKPYCLNGPYPILIVDDVCSTGKSLEDARAGRNIGSWPERHIIGIVAFSRGNLPDWCKAVFSMSGAPPFKHDWMRK